MNQGMLEENQCRLAQDIYFQEIGQKTISSELKFRASSTCIKNRWMTCNSLKVMAKATYK